MASYSNPILKGFYPDPSICRVGEDYYLVTSTFTYFPGVPIFHSRDLVHWQQIGHVLDRPSQLPLLEGEHSHGIFAPTLRYYQGIFYMITTNVSNGGNFVVTSTDPAGPWSEPYWLDAEGIDPSLFFDEDGRCWYSGTKDRREGAEFWGDNEIFIQELDLDAMTLIGPSYPAWHGALRGAKWAEGPHIYKKEGWYYLLISEGGTGHEHALTIARSKSLTETFVGFECNPILTHRHLGKSYPIVNVGHGDLVETQKGAWWMVLLASRPYGGYYRNLGRETFLVPVVWEDGWPVVCPGKGLIPMEQASPELPEFQTVSPEATIDFQEEALPKTLVYLRNPKLENYDLSCQPGWLTMTLSQEQLNDNASPSAVFRRQGSMSYRAEARMAFYPSEGERAGICLFQSNNYYYSMEQVLQKDVPMIRLMRCYDGEEELLTAKPLQEHMGIVDLKVIADRQALSFYFKAAEALEYQLLSDDVDGRILSTDVAGGFVGTVIGLFGVTEAAEKGRTVAFDWLKLMSNESEG